MQISLCFLHNSLTPSKNYFEHAVVKYQVLTAVNMGESYLSKLGEETRITEDDIPGARLVKSVDDSHCAELKRWLLCEGQGAKKLGKMS